MSNGVAIVLYFDSIWRFTNLSGLPDDSLRFKSSSYVCIHALQDAARVYVCGGYRLGAFDRLKVRIDGHG